LLSGSRVEASTVTLACVSVASAAPSAALRIRDSMFSTCVPVWFRSQVWIFA